MLMLLDLFKHLNLNCFFHAILFFFCSLVSYCSLKLEHLNFIIVCREASGAQQWKPFGMPLISSIPCDEPVTGAVIQQIVKEILSPLRKKEHLDQSKADPSSYVVAPAPADYGPAEASTKPVQKDLKKNGGYADEIMFDLKLADASSSSIDLSSEEVVECSSSLNSISVFLDWSEKLLEKYDTHYLETLPEVCKYGPVTKKSRTEPLSLYTCLEAFLREEPLVPEDMW